MTHIDVPWYIQTPWLRFGLWLQISGMIGLILLWLQVKYEYDHPEIEFSKPHSLKAAFIVHFALYFGMMFTMSYPTFIVKFAHVLCALEITKLILGESALFLVTLILNIILSISALVLVLWAVKPKQNTNNSMTQG